MNRTSSQITIDAIPQQVWVANAIGEVVDINLKVSTDFGLNKLEILERGWTSFVHPADLKVSIATWEASIASGKEYVTEFRLLFSDGNYYWHLAKATQIIEVGKEAFWVGTNTNISTQKQNESIKEEFISVASHELKTPLTTIKGYNQLLLRVTKDATSLSYLNRSLEQLGRLEKLVRDLMDVSKINAGKLAFNFEHFDFSSTLTNTVAGLQHIYPSHQIILDCEPDLHISGDKFRIEQVIQNFISNAVKYSPNGNKVHVNAKIEMNYLVVSVQDFGIGIEREELNKLFERYYRADNATTRFEGLGLGLYISADIIKRHDGSLWIESELGRGSTFFFKIPLQAFNIEQVEATTDFYKDKYLTISCVAGEQTMYVDWYGHQDMHSVKHGGKLMIEYLRKNNCSKVFNDNRKVIGTWSEASDWAAEVWLPEMEKAGLRYFAWIFSESIFSQLSAMKSVENENKSSNIQFFADAEKAKIWLAETV